MFKSYSREIGFKNQQLNIMAALFQTLCTASALLAAWKLVKTKNAAGGVDGMTVNEFEKDLSEHLAKLEQELKHGT